MLGSYYGYVVREVDRLYARHTDFDDENYGRLMNAIGQQNALETMAALAGWRFVPDGSDGYTLQAQER